MRSGFAKLALSLMWGGSLALLLVIGCGKKSDTVSIGGRVSYRGQPLSDAAVTFYPTAGRPVSAPVSDQGEYEIELLPGDYTVTVNVGAEIPPGYKEGDPLPPPKVELPPQYTTMAQTKLTATVSESGQQIDFELK
jgi:hypothetical protein